VAFGVAYDHYDFCAGSGYADPTRVPPSDAAREDPALERLTRDTGGLRLAPGCAERDAYERGLAYVEQACHDEALRP